MAEMEKLKPEEAFERLGQITRQLHQAMSELGFDTHLHRIASEIPDARDRLAYVGQMTDAAAHKVLGLVEAARPKMSDLSVKATDQYVALKPMVQGAVGTATAGDVQPLLQSAYSFSQQAASLAHEQDEVLRDIMLAQDFQDLSGQVIKKVIDIISRTETQLLQLLSQSAPEHLAVAAAAANEQLQGPQTPDKALKQDDVDDLLASLGF